MTVEELDRLTPFAEIWLPDGWYVTKYLWGGRVVNGKHVTLLMPPDKHGVVSDRRPYYMTVLEMLPATSTEQAAWEYNAAACAERQKWIRTVMLKEPVETYKPN